MRWCALRRRNEVLNCAKTVCRQRRYNRPVSWSSTEQLTDGQPTS